MEIGTNNMYPTRHWFVPLDELDASAGTSLRLAEVAPVATDPVAKDGDSFLVTLETLLIVNTYDSRSDNDLLVRSRLKYGNDPMVEAINFFENDVPAGVVRNNLLCEYIYAQETYSKLDRVHLEVEVMELPGDISLNKDIGKGLRAIKNTFGMVLSSFLPFGGVAFDVMEKVNTVRKEKRRIFLSTLDLYGDGGEGEARLRYGAYVFFREPVDGSKFKLQKLQLKHRSPQESNKPFPYDYIVVKIVPAPIRVGSNEALTLKNQKLATILGAMNGQLDTTVGHPRFDRDVIPDADKLLKLARLYSLKKRKNARETLDDTQNRLYQKLLEELKEFL